MARGDDQAGGEEFSVERILDELHRQFVLLPPQAGEFTKAMFGRQHGLTQGEVESAFGRMLASGAIELIVDDCGQPVVRNVNGHRAKVYRRLQAGADT